MSAPVTEAHRKLVAAIIRDLSIDDGAQLIADSEAKAVEQANAQVESLLSAAKNSIPASEHPAEPTVENWAWQIRNLGEDRRLVYADRDKLRAEVERLKRDYDYDHKCLYEVRERCELWKQRAERAEAELKALRLVCGTTDADKFTTWVDRANARAEEAEAELAFQVARKSDLFTQRDEAVEAQEKAEAELKEWSLLNLWGGTPEIVHAFVKGQQARIHAAQDVEGELESTKERALTLANSLDQAQTELAELKESVLVQQIFSDDRIRANAAEAELDGIRALADRRNERDHSQDTTHQLVAALDQALDIAQAELKAERARLDWLEENAGDIQRYNSSRYIWSAHQNLRAVIDAAMKKGRT